MDFLTGKKTYLCAIIGAVATGLKILGWLPESAYESIMGLVVSGGFFFQRKALQSATDPIGKPE